MQPHKEVANYWLRVSCFCLLGLMFMALPLPAGIGDARPNMLACVLLFGVLNPPHRLSVGTAFIAGLLLSALTGQILGVQSLCFVLMVYLVHVFYRPLIMFPRVQQRLCVFVTMLVMNACIFACQQGLGQSLVSEWYLLSPLLSALVWAGIFYPCLDMRAIARDDFLVIQQ